MLQRLARTCYRRRWAVLGAWVVLLVGLYGLNSAGGDPAGHLTRKDHTIAAGVSR